MLTNGTGYAIILKSEGAIYFDVLKAAQPQLGRPTMMTMNMPPAAGGNPALRSGDTNIGQNSTVAIGAGAPQADPALA